MIPTNYTSKYITTEDSIQLDETDEKETTMSAEEVIRKGEEGLQDIEKDDRGKIGKRDKWQIQKKLHHINVYVIKLKQTDSTTILQWNL